MTVSLWINHRPQHLSTVLVQIFFLLPAMIRVLLCIPTDTIKESKATFTLQVFMLSSYFLFQIT